MNAKTFVERLAADLTAAGWNVELTDEVSTLGYRTISFYATRNTFEAPISGSALLSKYTNRWNFCGVRLYPLGDTIHYETYASARCAVNTWGGLYSITA